MSKLIKVFVFLFDKTIQMMHDNKCLTKSFHQNKHNHKGLWRIIYMNWIIVIHKWTPCHFTNSRLWLDLEIYLFFSSSTLSCTRNYINLSQNHLSQTQSVLEMFNWLNTSAANSHLAISKKLSLLTYLSKS